MESFNDHRIVMMEAIASLISDKKVIIEGKAAVAKSYPDFFSVMKANGLDGNIE